jgi:uncharacterized Zn finger protein (UPF0148 family)
MTDEILGTKCPRCGHEWKEPDWRCPDCYYEFGTELKPSKSPGKRAAAPSSDDKPRAISDHSEEQVANPERAKEKNSAQFTRRGLGRIANVMILPAAGLLALVIGASDKSEGFTIIGFVMLGIGGFILVMLGQFQKGLDLIQEGRKQPKMSTPEDTLDTFFSAMCRSERGADDRLDRFYARAFNCLSDTAQQATGSLDAFQKHWENLGYGWAPDRANMRRRGVSQPKKTAEVRVHFDTAQAQQGTTEVLRKEFDKDFILVERGGFWFMTDGLFLPQKTERSR